MMKSLLIFTLSLISGPVGCVVTGYTGGSIIIISDLKWDFRYIRYICKKERTSCTDIIRTDTTKNSVQEGRFMLYENTRGFVTVLIRGLEPQDAGTYRMGVGSWLSTDVTLTATNDSCCPGPKTMHAFPGQNISIISNYPVVYDRHYKYIMKLDNGSVLNDIVDTHTQSQNNRFSISDDRNAKVLGLSISNVTEADDGVYLCGVFNRMNSVEYFSFFTEIQLHVRAKSWTEISSDRTNFKSSSTMIIIIIVCVCVALLLIGGFTLMAYKMRHMRTQDSAPSSKDNEQVHPGQCIYEEIDQTTHVSATDTELYMDVTSHSPDTQISSTVPPPQEQNLTYTTVSFQKNPDDAAITFRKEESTTEYATVQHTSTVE
ncbi:uncharacterized protein LOC131365801 [Hemibagrus wyckioides]|uniref:uncharacterized protein LOC131365801 n=1 Tax=Hemibagrus wyckioides TaxID=337641 RepID=UPI00266B8214|nr:uncharacterized protein LOC131365801 [Hemibagrus wyckioides]